MTVHFAGHYSNDFTYEIMGGAILNRVMKVCLVNISLTMGGGD